MTYRVEFERFDADDLSVVVDACADSPEVQRFFRILLGRLNVPKGSLEVSVYYPPVPVNTGLEEYEARPGTTPEYKLGWLTASFRALPSYRRTLIAITVMALHFLLGYIFVVNTVTAARSSATASDPLELTFLTADTSPLMAPPLNPDPLLKTSFHLPEFPAFLVEEETPIPSSSMAITIPAPNEPRPDRVQPPPALNAADFNSGTVRDPCAAPILADVTKQCRTRGFPSHP
jgi:hypothetical protein